MKNIRKLVTVVLTLSLTLSLAACGSENSSNGSVTADREKNQNVVYRTLDEIKESGTINIGVFSDKNPFGYVDENGEYQGYDVYFANRIGEDLGVKINYVSTEAANRIEYLQTGKADIILANFTVTPQRAEEVDFALPYMNVALGVIIHQRHNNLPVGRSGTLLHNQLVAGQDSGANHAFSLNL